MKNKLEFLIKYLLSENEKYQNIKIPEGENERFKLFRSLVNVRAPEPVSEEFLTIQDELLQEMTARKGIVNYKDLTPVKPRVYLWQGDITALRCSAIVNAANSALLGCFCPCHGCIDNAIHTFAGIGLRLECAELMRKQGYEEPVGRAKITGAYDLPCEKIIHTVGPFVSGQLTDIHRKQLRACYRECLQAAVDNGISSVAFCCISTGEFHFPNEEAAKIAVETVDEFLRSNGDIEVIFNVFKDYDLGIYKMLLGADRAAETHA